jgi:lactose/L-arabinose transport system permease protein
MRLTLGLVAFNLAIGALAVVWLMPLWLMVVYATVSDADIFSPVAQLWPGDQFGANWQQIVKKTVFVPALLNSIGIAIIYTTVSVLLSSLAGFALARYRFFGRDTLLIVLAATLTIPFVVLVIPQYILVARDMGLANSWAAVIIPPLFNALGVIFMRQSFLSLPQELLEAARLDGAGEFRVFCQIALPLTLPAVAALAIILFLGSWNNYLWPLLVGTGPEAITAPVALGSLMGIHAVPWASIMAGALVLTLPMVIIFLFLQRYFISGITAGSVR